jgi:hypothetical protein
VDSLKALDPNRPIREADMAVRPSSASIGESHLLGPDEFAAEFGAYMSAETATWARVIKLANIKAE